MTFANTCARFQMSNTQESDTRLYLSSYSLFAASCRDAIDNCAQYGTKLCEDVKFYNWVNENCKSHCNRCGEYKFIQLHAYLVVWGWGLSSINPYIFIGYWPCQAEMMLCGVNCSLSVRMKTFFLLLPDYWVALLKGLRVLLRINESNSSRSPIWPPETFYCVNMELLKELCQNYAHIFLS